MTSTMAQTINIGMPSTTGWPWRVPRENVSIQPASPIHWNTPVSTLPPKSEASQSPSAFSLIPPIIVLRVVAMAAKMVSPRKMYRNASVTMKLGNPVLITSQPFTPPKATQSMNVAMMAIHMGQPRWTERMAMLIPAKPIIEPTDRSNSPAIINRHAPTAMMANCADTIDQFMTPAGPNMPLSRAVSRKKIKTRIMPAMPPNSGLIRASRNRERFRTRSSASWGLDPSVIGPRPCQRLCEREKGRPVCQAARWFSDLAELARELFDFFQAICGHKTGAGVDVVAGQNAVAVIVGQDHNGQVSLQEGLLVDAPLDDAGLDAFDDVLAQVKRAEIDVACQAHFLKREDGGIRRGRPKRQDGVQIGVGIQVRDNPVFDLGRVLARVDHRIAQLDAQTVSKATAAFGHNGVRNDVVHTDKRPHAVAFGAQTGSIACVIFRLTHKHQSAHFARLLGSAGVHDDDIDALINSRFDRTAEDVKVSQRRDDAIGARGRRLINDPCHVGKVTGGRVAVLDLNTHLIAGQRDAVLDGVPPAVAVGRVADQNVFLAFRVRACRDHERCRNNRRRKCDAFE
mmetsp:Transcript_22736/g.37606  ORF Transcript_22736/g.37606 Transcript_22736/m.37606 type:complete len:569 (+) Transcript_22736:230-1936(+)